MIIQIILTTIIYFMKIIKIYLFIYNNIIHTTGIY